MVIDVHTHSFPEKISAKVVEKLQEAAKSKAYTLATDRALIESMKAAGIDVSILLPVATNEGQVEKLNSIAAEKNSHFAETELFSLGAMHPDYEEYEIELKRLKSLGITGIKLHPAYQAVDLDDIRYLRIIEKACELDLAVIIHAGLDIGIPHHNFSSPKHIENVMKTVAPKNFVLAHLGGWKGWDEVEKSLCGMDLYMDTAFVLGSYEPPKGVYVSEEEKIMLSDEQFIRIVKKHGADKVLFGTDSPWSDQSETLLKVKSLIKDEADQEAILYKNAKTVFKI